MNEGKIKHFSSVRGARRDAMYRVSTIWTEAIQRYFRAVDPKRLGIAKPVQRDIFQAESICISCNREWLQAPWEEGSVFLIQSNDSEPAALF